MSDETLPLPVHKRPGPVSAISFIVGIAISCGPLFTFMETRMDKGKSIDEERIIRLEERIETIEEESHKNSQHIDIIEVKIDLLRNAMK